MTRFTRRLILLLAFALNFFGLVLFVKWLAQTDVMFGHYEGPAALVFASTGLFCVGVFASITWYGSVLIGRSREPRDPDKKRWPGILAGVLLLILLVPSAFSLFFGTLFVLDKLAKSPTFEPLVESYKEWTAEPPRPVDEAKTAEELIPFLEDEDEGVRLSAAHHLGELGPPALSALAALRAAKNDPVPLVRVYVAEALWKVTGEPGEPVAMLVGVLETEEEKGYADATALTKLANMGPAAEAAIPALEKMAQTDSRPSMRREARTVLGYVRPEEAGEPQ